MLLFVIQRSDAQRLRPNTETDLAFAEALRAAAETGVAVAAHTCRVTTRRIVLGPAVPVNLG
jgi:DNA-binding sugar fermentation-stimulating protein